MMTPSQKEAFVELLNETTTLHAKLTEVERTCAMWNKRDEDQVGLIDKLRDELKHETQALIFMTHSRDAFRHAASQNYDAVVSLQERLAGARGERDGLAYNLKQAQKRIDDLLPEIDAARKMYGELVAELAENPNDPIPAGVFYDRAFGMFYNINGERMPPEFQRYWAEQSHEFPEPGAVAFKGSPHSEVPFYPHIKLTRSEIQSNHTRVKWAEGLILQLPETHDGRNSWLLNFGVSDEAMMKRYNFSPRIEWDEDCRAAVGSPGVIGSRPDVRERASGASMPASASPHAPRDKTDDWEARHDVQAKPVVLDGVPLTAPAVATPWGSPAPVKRTGNLALLEEAAREWHDAQTAGNGHRLYNAIQSYFGIKPVIPD